LVCGPYSKILTFWAKIPKNHCISKLVWAAKISFWAAGWPPLIYKIPNLRKGRSIPNGFLQIKINPNYFLTEFLDTPLLRSFNEALHETFHYLMNK
jgi:hypothetical protein